MRTLAPVPAELALGSFRGALGRVDWPASAATRLLRRKKWLYVAISCDDAWLSLVILRTGYAANILAYVFDRNAARMIVDKTVVAPAMTTRVADDVHASGTLARYAFLGSNIVVERSGPDVEIRARFGGIELDVVLDESAGPPGIVAVTDFGGGRDLRERVPRDSRGLRAATEKRGLARVRGRFHAAGRSFNLAEAMGGWDYTNGLLPRHTKWRWAYGLGRDVAFNLAEGNVGPENALFHGGDVHGLAEPRFFFDRERPDAPWRIEGEGIDLRFDVGAVHAQNTNLGIVRTRFLQPVGTFSGTIGGVTVDGLPGVVEDQDVLW